MGGVCTRMDSIEHAQNLDDIRNIIHSDKRLFQLQLEVLEKDRTLDVEIKLKKVNYFVLIITKLEEYHNYLTKLLDIKDLEVFELKIKYKHLMKEVDSLQYKNITEQFDDFDVFLYKELQANFKNVSKV